MEHRLKGNQAIKDLDYLTAILEYTKGLRLTPLDPALWCNRAFAYIQHGEPELAVLDAIRARTLLLEQTVDEITVRLLFKAIYREGQAYAKTELFLFAIDIFGILLDL